MNQEQATSQLHRELHEYMSLTDEQQKQAFWERIRQDSEGRTDAEKALIQQAIADDVEQVKQRVLDLKKRVDEFQSIVPS